MTDPCNPIHALIDQAAPESVNGLLGTLDAEMEQLSLLQSRIGPQAWVTSTSTEIIKRYCDLTNSISRFISDVRGKNDEIRKLLNETKSNDN